jgi:desulfoferrodoxin-like iron-binding protein
MVSVLRHIHGSGTMSSVDRQTPNRKEDIMSKKADVFKCESCEMIVTVLKEGKGQLNCCEKTMAKVTPDEAKRFTFDMQRPGAP